MVTVSNIGVSAARNEVLAGWARISSMVLTPLVIAALVGAWSMVLGHERAIIRMEAELRFRERQAEELRTQQTVQSTNVQLLMSERGAIQRQLLNIEQSQARLEKAMEKLMNERIEQ